MNKNYNKYFEANKALWNKRVDLHFNSEFYSKDKFRQTKNSLNSIELEELGDVSGKTILHLQCHFGQDTLSLANLGAEVTGVDFSEVAINKATELSSELNIKSDFICSNIYDLKEKLDKKFDIVFTSYGTIGWLPDIKKWAEIVSHFLKPSGKFLIVEFHPFIWMLDEKFENIKYSYFHTDEPIAETSEGTYTDKEADIKMIEYGWNHTISDVINSLISNGLEINSFKEFDYSPYNCFPNMIEKDKGKFVFEKYSGVLPMIYSLKAVLK
jgi:ubiquinone/menaquinone biosynthesis C-methylase UbiE